MECGAHVFATICPGEVRNVYKHNDKPFHVCVSDEDEIIDVRVGANQSLDLREVLDADVQSSAVILKHHPWVAKGEHYLGLRKEEKADILWEKINES